MVPLILETLTFRSNNTAHQPVIEALDWLRAHHDDRRQFISRDEVPIDGVVRSQFQEMLLDTGPDGDERINCIDYEICVLQSLRERLRCKEIWVEGADRYRNPDEDLPLDFDANRETYYQALRQPMDAEQFITIVQQTMRQWLGELDTGLPINPMVRSRTKGKNRIPQSATDSDPTDQLGPDPPAVR